ncbi:hypothetical protein [Streptomyces milbemycinicus]|uniref:hypothetical protein n=1 Tax=Streptomyces milbemycinicus TaxID=476552 RepID=UPI0033C2FACC
MTASMAFYADAGTTVRLNEYGTKSPPILTLDGRDHTLSVSSFGRIPVADQLAFAHALATAAADYIKALETYTAARADGDQKPDGQP